MRSAQVDKVTSHVGAADPYPASIEQAVGTWGRRQVAEAAPYAEVAALCPLGVFDSGMGGLSIVAEIRRVLPAEDIVYFADSANIPYGGRSDEWLRARSAEIADFLLEQGAKAIVVACNTASAAGLEHLRAWHSAPIVGLVPAVKPAVSVTRSGTVGVLATEATGRGRLLADVIERFAEPAGVEVVTTAPSGLVEAVERGELSSPETAEVVRNALAPMIERGADAVVLGCTHYPFLKPLIRQFAGDGVLIIDSSEGVARQTRRVLEARNLLRSPDGRNGGGTLTIFTSGDPETVRTVARRLVGEEVSVLSGLGSEAGD